MERKPSALKSARRSKPARAIFYGSKLPATKSNLKLSNLSLHRCQLPNYQNSPLKSTAKTSASA
jgi:hypothetical protein